MNVQVCEHIEELSRSGQGRGRPSGFSPVAAVKYFKSIRSSTINAGALHNLALNDPHLVCVQIPDPWSAEREQRGVIAGSILVIRKQTPSFNSIDVLVERRGPFHGWGLHL